MKVMSREFTTSEKILLVVLGIVLFGLVYYRFVYLTTQDMATSLKTERETKESELEIAQAKLQKLQSMKKELDELRITGKDTKMGSYNNSKRETAFLNQVLSGVSDYSISFSDITRNGNQIRRSFSLQFKTDSYKKATQIVKELSEGEYRCLVDDINYSLTDDGKIYVDLTATFFETMVGGTPDSALPKDESSDGSGQQDAAHELKDAVENG